MTGAHDEDDELELLIVQCRSIADAISRSRCEQLVQEGLVVLAEQLQQVGLLDQLAAEGDKLTDLMLAEPDTECEPRPL